MRALTLGWIALLAATMAMNAAADSRAIYRCEVNGVPSFSDRPCAPSADRIELDPADMNTYEAPPVANRSTPAPSKRNVPKQAGDPAGDLRKKKAACERIAQGLKDVRAKMRSGYKASEGQRLEDRQDRLKSQLRSARCS